MNGKNNSEQYPAEGSPERIAAEALLQLHTSSQSNISDLEERPEMVALLLCNLGGSNNKGFANVAPPTPVSLQVPPSPEPGNIVSEEVVLEEVASEEIVSEIISTVYVSPKKLHTLSPINEATLTETPEVESLEHLIEDLDLKIKLLEYSLSDDRLSLLKLSKDSIVSVNVTVNDGQPPEQELSYNTRASNKRKRRISSDTTSDTTIARFSFKKGTKKSTTSSTTKAKVDSNNKMVSIGYGNTKIPSSILNNIDWATYTSATRKLLTAVFSRKVLATHSLTGKRSPAFPHKPAKKKLNPLSVKDIVKTVVDNCHVPESAVRTSITTKCADEAKMLRTRQKPNNTRSSVKHTRENIPCSGDESA